MANKRDRNFEAADVLRMFPTFVWKADLKPSVHQSIDGNIVRAPATELTAENADQVVVTVKNGTLLVFTAWLPHPVDANESGKPKISISFNIMFSAYAEELSKPLW